MSKFQLILTFAFGAFIIIGVIVFSIARSGGEPPRPVLIWGPISNSNFGTILNQTGLSDDKTIAITYVQKGNSTFDAEFVDALASGRGPDLIFLPQDKILRHKDKLLIIPFESYSERTFKDSFIEGAEIFLDSSGVVGLPVLVDPLVLYWNRTMFSNKLISQPPRYWDEMFTLATKLTETSGALNLSKSALPFGEYSNVTHAKEILSTLMMQAGTPIVIKNNNRLTSALNSRFDLPIVPAEAALNFFTEFSNPSRAHYSWSRSLPRSQDFFVANDLGLYFGKASELAQLKLRNPNLNFDVAMMPQSRSGARTLTFGDMFALAITKRSQSIGGAFAVATTLSSKSGNKIVASVVGLPSARRDLLAEKQSEAVPTIFNNSAIVSQAWLDPNPQETDTIFRTMVESVTGGRARVGEAVNRANSELINLLDR